MNFLHPDNTDELALIAEETGAEVLRGPLRYPSETGGWQLGDLDLSAHPQYHDHEITIIIAVTDKAKEQIFCGICGAALDKVEECSWCKLSNERIAVRVGRENL